jgi:hypothetical protein
VRGALASGVIGTGSPRSPEAIFGAELEGLSPEDQEFETARQFVRFAEEMARVAVHTAPDAAPGIVTSRAEQLAAHRLAPGLTRAIASPPWISARGVVRVSGGSERPPIHHAYKGEDHARHRSARHSSSARKSAVSEPEFEMQEFGGGGSLSNSRRSSSRTNFCR